MRLVGSLPGRLAALGVFVLVPLATVHVEAQRAKRGTPVQKPRGAAAAGPRRRFAAGRAAPNIPFELVKNLVFVQTRVNGSRPLWFILDTGASASVLNAGVAKELGLRATRTERGSATAGEIQVGIIDGVSLSLPGVTVSGLTVGALPLDALAPVVGRHVGGVIGYDFIREFVVEIDYGASRIDLREPAGYEYKGAGEVLPLTLVNDTPAVKAALVLVGGRAPFEGRFLIATASDEAMLVNTPFVKAHGLAELAPNLRPGNSGGAGGLSRSLQGRAAGLRLGRFAIDRPLVTLSQGEQGDVASNGYDGLVGGEVLRRFKLIIDYSRRRVILEPNARLREPVETDMSGLEFIGEGDDFRRYVINEVVPDSPASEAGFKEEDVLTAIDARPAASLTLEQVRELLRREGEERALTVRRGEETLNFRIKLRRLL